MLSADFIKTTALPSHDELFELSDKACMVLENENESYRPKNKEGFCGGLIDFSAQRKPLILIPDLHGRPEFLKNILEVSLPPLKDFWDAPTSVLNLLEDKKICMVFVGDAMHTEKTTVYRWCEAQSDFEKGIFTGEAMSAEMAENLTLLCGLMKLKISFPEDFHFLKGNHENITNRNTGGDFAFRKYADEGNMVKYFIRDFYGDDILYMISCFEDALPLMFAGQKILVSHAEPIKGFSRKQVINSRLDPKVVEGLTWTDNDNAFEDSCRIMFQEFFGKENAATSYFFGGHRPVQENYKIRQNGSFIQFHNPLKQNIIFLKPDKEFNPKEDIINVSTGESHE